jgi:hypothetical protein
MEMKIPKCYVCSVLLTTENWYYSNKPKRNFICKKCAKKKVKEYRRKSLIQTGGKIIHVPNKRTYPKDCRCEICDKTCKRVVYHHWDDRNPSNGIWVCSACHSFVERFEAGFLKKYLELKEKIQGGNLL